MTTSNKSHEKVSKFLSLVLRHKPEEIGITLDDAGWVSVEELLQACNQNDFALDRALLEAVVAGSDKQRFAFSADGAMIRANQGHSVDVSLGLQPIEPPALLYHGTASRFLESIHEHGLIKQQRTHVHLSADLETASKVGVRHGKLVVLKVAAGRMHAAGLLFYKSANGVWLTDKVPPDYLEFPPSE